MKEIQEAVDGLRRFGLSAYEAKVFIGLHALTTGSASEVAEVTDVPRSQVYGAAEGLERRGLLDVQEGTPTVYRPVPIEQARDALYDQLEAETEPAFARLEEIAGSHAGSDGDAEAIWRTERKENVAARAAELIADADERVVYGAGDVARVEERIQAALESAADRGVDVTVVSGASAVLDSTAGRDERIHARPVADDAALDVSNGRIVVADGRAVLMSVLPTDAVPGVTQETAFWSSDTAFAGVLATLVGEWMGTHLSGTDGERDGTRGESTDEPAVDDTNGPPPDDTNEPAVDDTNGPPPDDTNELAADDANEPPADE